MIQRLIDTTQDTGQFAEDKEMSGKDSLNGVYAPISEALARMNGALGLLLTTHDDFVLQNVKTMNSVKTLAPARRAMEASLRENP